MSDFNCPFLHITDFSRLYRQYEELEREIKLLTGKDLKCLKVLFSQGWTLTPPEKTAPDSMTELAAMIENDV